MKLFLLGVLIFILAACEAGAVTTHTVECKFNNDIETVAFTTTSGKFDMEQQAGRRKKRVYVANIHRPAAQDDFISFEENGYTMTYPLDCKKM